MCGKFKNGIITIFSNIFNANSLLDNNLDHYFKKNFIIQTDQILLSWGNESYSDVTFLCKSSSGTSSNKCLRANKAVLAAGSRKLQLLLADTGDEDVHIIVPDGDFQTTKLLLQYIYTGKVLVGQERELLESLIYEWVLIICLLLVLN